MSDRWRLKKTENNIHVTLLMVILAVGLMVSMVAWVVVRMIIVLLCVLNGRIKTLDNYFGRNSGLMFPQQEQRKVLKYINLFMIQNPPLLLLLR